MAKTWEGGGGLPLDSVPLRMDMLPVLTTTGEHPFEVGLNQTRQSHSAGGIVGPELDTQPPHHLLPIFQLPQVSAESAKALLRRFPADGSAAPFDAADPYSQTSPTLHKNAQVPSLDSLTNSPTRKSKRHKKRNAGGSKDLLRSQSFVRKGTRKEKVPALTAIAALSAEVNRCVRSLHYLHS
jgi:hypothetical protein